MERYGTDPIHLLSRTPHNLSTPSSQPGLEVGADPFTSGHNGWPDASRPVWGVNSTDRLVDDSKQYGGSDDQKDISVKGPFGLSRGTLWGLVVLFCVIFGGGIGGGIGAGLASQKNTCARLFGQNSLLESMLTEEQHKYTSPF